MNCRGGRTVGRLGVSGLLALTVLSVAIAPMDAAAATTAPSSLSDVAPGIFSGCNPVSEPVSPGVQEALSLVLPSAFVSVPTGNAEQANSFLNQAEVVNLAPLTVVYDINPKARWANGNRIGLADFLATWRMGVQGDQPTAVQYRLIRSITALAANQIRVTFTSPDSDWRALFSPLLPASVAPKALESCQIPSASTDLSGGPFEIESASRTAIDLTANPAWWGTAPAFSRVELRTSTNPSVSTNEANSTFGIAQSSWVTTSSLAGLTSTPNSSSHVDFSNQLISLDFNTRGGITRSVRVRKAIADVINRRMIISETAGSILPTVGPAGSHLLAQGQPGYSGPAATKVTATTTTTTPATNPYDQALLKAKVLLHNAGFSEKNGTWSGRAGHGISLRLGVPINDRWAIDVALAARGQLARHGLRTRVVVESNSAAVAGALRAQRIDVGFLVRPTDSYLSHAAAWYSAPVLGPTSPLWSGDEDPVLTRLAAQARVIMNPVTASPLYKQFDQRLWATMASLPIMTEPWVFEWSTRIAGVTGNPYPPGTLAALPTWKILPPGETPPTS